MIQNITITGLHFEVDPEIEKYVQRKIGNLDRYVSRHARESTWVEVRLKEDQTKDKMNRICEVTIHLPNDIIITKESTLNMYAAIDIAEAKLKNKLTKYKSEHIHSKIHQKWLKRQEDRQL